MTSYVYLSGVTKSLCEESLLESKSLIKNEIELKTNILKVEHVKFKTNDNMLHSDSIKNSLSELHQKFIVIPTDNGNVAVICKRF